ncbi:hypothetical protein GCM10008965_42390 [Methylorubrum aminovorans]|nr:hypothetical protein GCM10025880_43090 [Methylorubrum aminovorans]
MVIRQPVSRPKLGEAGRRASTAKAQRFRDEIRPVIAELRGAGITTCEGLARGLRVQGIRKPRGGLVWTSCEIRRLLRKISE